MDSRIIMASMIDGVAKVWLVSWSSYSRSPPFCMSTDLAASPFSLQELSVSDAQCLESGGL